MRSAFGLCEVDHLSRRIAAVVAAGRIGTQCPAGIGRDRDGHLGNTNAGDVIAVRVGLGNQCRIGRADQARRPASL